MPIPLEVAGITYQYPTDGEASGWGAEATGWAQAITQNVLTKAGGSFTLTAEIDFGSSFGIAVSLIKSKTASISSAGFLRLAHTDEIAWRNFANDGNLTLVPDSDDELVYNAEILATQTWVTSQLATQNEFTELTDTPASYATHGNKVVAVNAGATALEFIEIANVNVAAAAAIAYSKLDLTGGVVNADVNSSAAIAFSKMEDLTASRALVTGAGGKVETSAVTATELSYLVGVNSAISTDLGSKVNAGILTTKGDIFVATGSAAISRLPVGTNNQVLVADSAVATGIKWANQASSPPLAQNIIINGAMEIWQRGTSFEPAPSGQFPADRWRYAIAGGQEHDIEQDSDVPDADDFLFRNSLSVEVRTANSSPAALDITLIQQRIEGYNFKHIAQKTFTLSFWVKSSVTGIYNVGFRNSPDDISYVAEYTVNAANTWEKKTITVPPSPSSGTWDYTNGVGLAVSFIHMTGTDRHTATPNTWLSGSLQGTAAAVNFDATVGNIWKLTGVQVNLGGEAATFTRAGRTYGGELAACQRYYEICGGGSTGLWLSGSACTLATSYSVKKRSSSNSINVSRSDPSVIRVGTAVLTATGSSISQVAQGNSGCTYVIDGFSGGALNDMATAYQDVITVNAEL